MTQREGADAGLVLVATPIGNLGDLTDRARAELAGADAIACEDTRRTRQLLTHEGIAGVRLLAVHEHNETEAAAGIVALIGAGQRVALVTDAGMPAISDPGERVVRAVIDAGLPVTCVPGPSAALTALVLSGLPAARFSFEGFLPRKGPERARRLAEVAGDRRTTVLFEAPTRVAGTLRDLAAVCGPDRRVAVARELTKVHEEVWRGLLGDAVERADAAAGARGEHVLVVEGAPEPDPAGPDDIEDALRARLAAGDDKRAAVAAVTTALGVSKRTVYDAALRLPFSST